MINGQHTAGLNNPPLIRKKTHALTASENPKHKLIYSSWAGLLPALMGAAVAPAPTAVDGILFATCVPDNAKNKNKTVPTNSPEQATM